MRTGVFAAVLSALAGRATTAAAKGPGSLQERFEAGITRELGTFAARNRLGIWVALRTKHDGDVAVALGTSDGGTTAAATTDVIPIGSYAKPWTAVAVLKLVEKGAFGLDDPIPPLIDPWLRKYNGTTLAGLGWTSEIGKVTVRMLLHMNSGLTSYNDTVIHQATLDHPHWDISPFDYMAINSRKFQAAPGTDNRYNSINFLLLGMILAGEADVPWDKYDQLGGALGPAIRSEYVNGTTFFLHGLCSSFPWVSHYYDWLGIDPASRRSTSQDMYDRSCLNGWAFGNIGASAISAAKFFDDLLGRHQRLLKPSTIAAMTRFGPGSVKPYENCSYGLGIWRVTELSLHPDWVDASFPGIKPYLSYMGHAGDDYGTVSRSAWHPELEMAFSVMINRWWNDYPVVKTDMHSVYCHFWKVLLPLMVGDAVPGVAQAFSCPAVN